MTRRVINKAAVILFCTNVLTLPALSVESIDDELPDASFLEFLAEVDEATGDGFDNWLATDTNADLDKTNLTDHKAKNTK